MSENTTNRSFAAEIAGSTNWLQTFSSSMGDAGGGASAAPAPAPAPAPAAAPAPSSATPGQPPALGPASPGSGLRSPMGVNPLLGGGEPAPAAAPAPAGIPQALPPAAPSSVMPQQPGAAPVVPGAQLQPGQPAPAAPEPQFLDFSGRRVPVPNDPVAAQALQNLYQDWKASQATITRQQQQIRQQQSPVAQPAPQPQPAPMAQPQAAPQQQPGSPNGGLNLDTVIQQAVAGVAPDQFLGQFYENPGAAMGGLLQKALSPLVSQITEQVTQAVAEQTRGATEWVQQQQVAESYSTEISTMASRPDLFPDLEAMQPVMAQVIENNPNLLQGPNPMATIYRVARGYAYGAPGGAQAAPGAAPAQLSVDSVLSNQELATQLMQHPTFRDQIIRSYVESLRTGSPPMTIGAAPGGVAPAMPPARPKDIRTAGQAWRQSLGV